MKAQFGDAVRALTDAEQDSKELKSAKRHALIEQIADSIDLPFPARGDAGEGGGPLDPAARAAVVAATDRLYKETVRTKIAVEKRRPDGRSESEIRPIASSVSVMPRTHGSALFTRGQTQALTLCTLGTAKEEQRIDDLSLDETKRYIHHYNFPPYSVGETGFMRGPKRRDIGHGALAERALVPVIPSAADFPYTLRLVSEILESNGSSSMASVCGSTLSLMDAGVPITAPVAGIAMGLIKEGDSYTILTDIQGAEDHLGDMDFKVAGTEQGVTALQMDIKITGVTTEILRSALAQARDARLHILAKMREAISEPRTELAAHAPRITSTKIAPDFIGMVIGKGGETIRSLEADYEVQIDIEEDGTIRIYGTNGELAEQARQTIEAMTKEVEVGDEYTGKIVKITDFGAFVELRKGVDGLLHVSRILPQGNRLQSAAQVLDRGDQSCASSSSRSTRSGAGSASPSSPRSTARTRSCRRSSSRWPRTRRRRRARSARRATVTAVAATAAGAARAQFRGQARECVPDPRLHTRARGVHDRRPPRPGRPRGRAARRRPARPHRHAEAPAAEVALRRARIGALRRHHAPPRVLPDALRAGDPRCARGDIAGAAGADTLIELGSGTSAKTRLLLSAMSAAGTLERFVPFDVDEATLRAAAAAIGQEYPGSGCTPWSATSSATCAMLPGGGTRMVAFLGSTIGNLTPAVRAQFLADLAAALAPATCCSSASTS